MLDSMRDGAGASGYDMEFVKSRRLPQLAASERRLFEEDGHGTLWVFYTHEKAWERNRTVLERRNLTVPVVKVRARNNGSHARRAIAKDFASLPPSVFLCVGLLVRLTVNLFKDAGIAWGLVNGALGTVVRAYHVPNGGARALRPLPWPHMVCGGPTASPYPLGHACRRLLQGMQPEHVPAQGVRGHNDPRHAGPDRGC
jgi:hypothetical protein